MMKLNRRRFLTTTAAGISAAAAPALLGQAEGQPASGKNLIVLFAQGGWDTTYVFDPKPELTTVDRPAGTEVRYEDIRIFADPSRAPVSAFFERHASITAVVNGIGVRSVAHPACTLRMLTGTANPGAPDTASIVGQELGPGLAVPHLVVSGASYPGPYAPITGRIGNFNELKAIVDPEHGGLPAPPGKVTFVPSDAEEQLIRGLVQSRADRFRATRGLTGSNRRRIEDFIASLDRGDLLRSLNGSIADFGLVADLQSQLQVGLDALETNMSQAITVDTGYGWDTHSNNAPQTNYFNGFFQVLDGLVDELQRRPGKTAGTAMFDHTVIAVMSEMSRTPKLNGENGKDHWPHTSMMLIGPNIRGGRTYGGTDDRMESLPLDLQTGTVSADGSFLSTDVIQATLLRALGVDPTAHFPGVPLLDAVIG